MPAGRVLRLELTAPGRVHVSLDGQHWDDLEAVDTGAGIWKVDVPGSPDLPPGSAVEFTVWWPQAGRWEGRDFRVDVVAAGDAR
jgi:glucoamylase